MNLPPDLERACLDLAGGPGRGVSLPAKAPFATEKAFQAAVVGLARAYGWRVAHFRPALTRRGRWVTPVLADGAGFPDLVMVRGGRLIFAELKTDTGRVTPDQKLWLAALRCAGADCRLWRPGDWGAIRGVLEGGR